MPNAALNAYYANHRSEIVLEADLEKGWGLRRKTYGFFHSKWVPYKGDLKVRAQLSLIAQPATFGDWAKLFPAIELTAGNELLSYRFDEKRLFVKISLLPGQAWRTTPEGRPEIFVAETPVLRVDECRWFDLRAWVVFHQPSRAPINDVRIWVENQLFVPGGQIESQRRRH
jgi:hypothetical protein